WPYIFGCLSLLVYGFRTRKFRAFAGAGIVGTGCFYGYTSVRVFPLLLFLFFLYEWKSKDFPLKPLLARAAVFGSFFFLGAAPVLFEMVRFRYLTDPNSDNLFIGHEMMERGSLLPLVRNIFQGLLLFNREGDPCSLHDVPYHRLFDDVTGILWILGLAYGLSRITHRKFFYALAGFFIFLLPSVLSSAPTQTSRCLDVAPFAALLAALFLDACGARLRAITGSASPVLWKAALVAGALLMVFENTWVYFRERPQNEECWHFPDIEANLAAREISSLGNGYDYYLSSRYFHHFVIMLLASAQTSSIHELDMPDTLEPPSGWDGKGLMFVLEEGRSGWLKLLEDLYPGGQAQDMLNWEGKPILHFYRVSPRQRYQARGLAGPQTGPVPEFPLRLPQTAGPYALEGSFFAEKTGTYRFSWEKGVSISWRLGGKRVVANRPVQLVRGFHPVRFQCSLRPGGATLALSQSYENEAYQALDPGKFIPRVLPAGLLGVYRTSDSWNDKPFLIQQDLLLNFAFHNDFPVKIFPPLSVSWTGNLSVPSTGQYRFMVLTTDWASFQIDGKFSGAANEEKEIFLRRGSHPLEVRFQKLKGITTSFHFLWELPGQGHFEVVPYQTFGALK
ncbi:MAG TPA: hypothetical protein VK859_05895, partial [bacterium]|nr:hypothetical protein [bacterium]